MYSTLYLWRLLTFQPENVLVKEDRDLKLSDFGFSRRVQFGKLSVPAPIGWLKAGVYISFCLVFIIQVFFKEDSSSTHFTKSQFL